MTKTLPTVEEFYKGKDNLDSLEAIMNGDKEVTTASGTTHKSVSQKFSEFDGRVEQVISDKTTELNSAIGAAGANYVDSYRNDPTLENLNDVTYYEPGNTYWKIVTNGVVPYDIDSATYPDPKDDPNLQLYAEINSSNSFKRFNTLTGLKASTSLAEGDVVETLGYESVGDGGGNRYKIVAAKSGADDGGSYINLSGSGLQAQGIFNLYQISINQFGAALGDGSDDDTSAITSCANYCKGKDVTITGKGVTNLVANVLIYNDCDFSQLKVILGDGTRGAGFIIKDDRDEADCKVTLSGDDLDLSYLTEGCATLEKVILDSTYLDDFSESHVFVESVGSVYIYRNSFGKWGEVMHKRSTTIMSKYGDLVWPVHMDYSEESDTTITLYKTHPKKLLFIPPELVLTYFDFNIPLRCDRNDVEIRNLKWVQRELDALPLGKAYASLFASRDCMNIEVNGFTTSGYGVTNQQSGISSRGGYDAYPERCANIIFRNVACGTSWKSIDSNDTVGLVIDGGYLDSVHSHFGCTTWTLKNLTIHGKTISMGTGSRFGKTVLDNVKFTSPSHTFFSIREDFGEFRDELDIINCKWDNKHSYTFPDDLVVVDLEEIAITASTDAGYTQPGEYRLPGKITIKNLKLRTPERIKLVNFPNGTNYNESDKVLYAPREIVIEDVDGHEVTDYMWFNYDWKGSYHDDLDPIRIRLNNIHSADDTPVHLQLGYNETTHPDVGAPNVLKFDFKATDGYFTTAYHLSRQIMGSKDSSVKFRDCKLRRLDTYHVSYGHLGEYYVNNCKVLFVDTDDASDYAFSGGYREVTETVFDASGYYGDNGTLTLTSTAHNSRGNVGIGCVCSLSDRGPDGSTDLTGGLRYLVNASGERNVYTKDASTGMLSPA